MWNGLETRERRGGVQVGGSQSKVCQRSLHRTAGVRTCKCVYNITIETSSKQSCTSWEENEQNVKSLGMAARGGCMVVTLSSRYSKKAPLTLELHH